MRSPVQSRLPLPESAGYNIKSSLPIIIKKPYLSLTKEQYEVVYEINLDYLMCLETHACSETYGWPWTQISFRD